MRDGKCDGYDDGEQREIGDEGITFWRLRRVPAALILRKRTGEGYDPSLLFDWALE
jgi:hypothetical protein